MGRKKSIREIITRIIFKLSNSKRLALTPQPKPQGASLADIDRYLFENFRSVYESDSSSLESTPQSTDLSFDGSTSTGSTAKGSRMSTDLSFDGSTSTGSTVKEAMTSTGSASPKLEDAMALVTESGDPYRDFKQSMKEMVETQHVDGVGRLDWDFLEQMLGYYLELNEEEIHDAIFRAFADLTEGLMVDDEASK